MTLVPMLDVRQLTSMERHVREIIASDEDRLEKAKKALRSLGDLPRGKQRVVKEQMRLVVGDLENVLGELKDVVGDLQVLVNQIDAVTNKLDEEYGPDVRVNERRRRKSTSNIEAKKTPETQHCKSKSFHHIEVEPDKKDITADTKKCEKTMNVGSQELTSPVWQLRSITSALNESHPQMSQSYTPEMYYYNDYPDPRFREFSRDTLMDRFLNSRMTQSMSSYDSHLTQSSVLSSIYNSEKTEGVMCRSSDTSGIMVSSKDSKMGESMSEPEYILKNTCQSKRRPEDLGVSMSDSNNNDSLKMRKGRSVVRCGQLCSSDKQDIRAIASGNTERLLRLGDDAVSDHDSFSMTSSTRSESSCGRDPNHVHCGPSCSMSPDSDYCGVYEREFEMKVELEYDDDLDNYYGIDECLSVELESFKECNVKYRDRNLNNDIWSNYMTTKDIGDDTDLDEDPFIDSAADVSSDLLNENMAASSIPTSPSDFGDYLTWERSIDGSDFS